MRWSDVLAVVFLLGAIAGVGLFWFSVSDQGLWNRLGVHPYVALYGIVAFVFACVVGLGVALLMRFTKR